MKKVAIRFHYPEEFFSPSTHPFSERPLKKSFKGKKRKYWDNYLDYSRLIMNQLLLENGYAREYDNPGCSYHLFPESDSVEKIAETIYLLLDSFNFRTELAQFLVEGSDSRITRYSLMSTYNPLDKFLS